MAKLDKLGARSPRIVDGSTYTGCNYADEPHERGQMPPMEYKLTVCSRHGTDKSASYTASLTEGEMLDTIAEWMKHYARNRAEERKRNAKR